MENPHQLPFKSWKNYKNGETIGMAGLEGGIIVQDEQYGDDTRITVEKGVRTAMFAVTFGYGGVFIHTHYTDYLQPQIYDSMKVKLATLVDKISASSSPCTQDDSINAIKQFISYYP